MFVEEGFRIRFANGETIDFYADNAEQKAGWMKVLADVIGKPDSGAGGRGWTEMVMRREAKSMMGSRKPLPKNADMAEERPSSAPKMEEMRQSQRSMLDVGDDAVQKPAPMDKSPRHAAHMRSAMGQAQRRQKTRSMIF
jgi:hypothetical protein